MSGDREAGQQMAGPMGFWWRVVQPARACNERRLWAQEAPDAAPTEQPPTGC